MYINVLQQSRPVAGGILSHPGLPVYLDWGDFYRREEYRRRAEEIFTAACNEANPYLYPIMDANLFLHPLYLLRYGRTEPCCVELLRELERIRPAVPERKRRARRGK